MTEKPTTGKNTSGRGQRDLRVRVKTGLVSLWQLGLPLLMLSGQSPSNDHRAVMPGPV